MCEHLLQTVLLGTWFGEIEMTHDARIHDVVLTRRDGSVRQFRIYGRPMPGKGDVITLPVDGQLITARVSVPLENPEVVKEMDYEARELAELSADD
jgi:hypothetical protein